MSLTTFWLYRKFRLNYAEHLTLNTFITAQTTLMGMLLMLILFITGHQNFNVIRFFTAAITLVSVSYHIVMYMQFFQQLNVKGFFKALLTYIVGLVIFFISTVILSFVGGFIYMLIKKVIH